jgi:hypothetical protein
VSAYATLPPMWRAAKGRRSGGRRVLLAAIVVPLTATALVAIGILLFGEFGDTEGRVLGTTALLAAYGLLALPAGFLFDQERLRALALTVLLLAVAGLSTALAAIWTDGGDRLGKTVLTATVFGIAATQTAALAAGGRGHDQAVVRRLFVLSVGLVLVVAGMGAGAAWAELDSDTYIRVLAALAVLDVLVVALQPILSLARAGAGVYRWQVAVEGEDEAAVTVEASDLASAAAKAIRQVERTGRTVTGLTRDAGSHD